MLSYEWVKVNNISHNMLFLQAWINMFVYLSGIRVVGTTYHDFIQSFISTIFVSYLTSQSACFICLLYIIYWSNNQRMLPMTVLHILCFRYIKNLTTSWIYCWNAVGLLRSALKLASRAIHVARVDEHIETWSLYIHL